MPAAKTVRLPLQGAIAWTDGCSGQTGVYVASHTVIGTSTRSAGTKVQDWRGKIARGESATSDLSGTYVSIDGVSAPQASVARRVFWCPPKYDTEIGTGWGRPEPFQFPITGSVSDSDIQLAFNKANACFRNKVNSAVSPFSGGVFLGELRQTISLLRHPLQGIRGLLDGHDSRVRSAMKRYSRRPKPIKSILDAAADSWLEVAFGWKPLISDMQNIGKAIKSLSKSSERISCESKMDLGTVFGNVDSITGPMGAIRAYVQTVNISSGSCRFTGVVGLESGFSALPSRLGVDLPAFIPTVWELIPYSFIVDYFSNAGEYVSSLCHDRTAALKWWNQTNMKSTKFYFSNWWGPASGSVLVSGGRKGVASGRTTTFQRKGGNGSGFPKLQLAFSSELNWRKILNLTALLQRSRLTSQQLGSIK